MASSFGLTAPTLVWEPTERLLASGATSSRSRSGQPDAGVGASSNPRITAVVSQLLEAPVARLASPSVTQGDRRLDYFALKRAARARSPHDIRKTPCPLSSARLM